VAFRGDGTPRRAFPTVALLSDCPADFTTVGRIQQTSFADPNRLVPAGTALFSAPADVERKEGKSFVIQGYRESSNVQPAAELVAMIRNSRYFDAAQRALRTLSEAVQLNTRPQ
jgi:flagellar basal body rod protein FlgG